MLWKAHYLRMNSFRPPPVKYSQASKTLHILDCRVDMNGENSCFRLLSTAHYAIWLSDKRLYVKRPKSNKASYNLVKVSFVHIIVIFYRGYSRPAHEGSGGLSLIKNIHIILQSQPSATLPASQIEIKKVSHTFIWIQQDRIFCLSPGCCMISLTCL